MLIVGACSGVRTASRSASPADVVDGRPPRPVVLPSRPLRGFRPRGRQTGRPGATLRRRIAVRRFAGFASKAGASVRSLADLV